MSNFERDVIFAELGEEKAWWKMVNSPKTKSVLDVRKDGFFQEKDIDFLQQTVDGKVNKIEVKSDRQAHETRNIVYETVSNGNTGCLLRSNADYVYYYFTESNEVFLISMSALRWYVSHTMLNTVRMGDGAEGYLINIDDLVESKVAICMM